MSTRSFPITVLTLENDSSSVVVIENASQIHDLPDALQTSLRRTQMRETGMSELELDWMERFGGERPPILQRMRSFFQRKQQRSKTKKPRKGLVHPDHEA